MGVVVCGVVSLDFVVRVVSEDLMRFYVAMNSRVCTF